MQLYVLGGAASLGLAAAMMWGLNALNQSGRKAALLARRRAMEGPPSDDLIQDSSEPEQPSFW
jgi:hypothetical protein